MGYLDLNKLAECRKQCSMTNEEIAEKAGLAPSTVSKVLSGNTTNPSIETLAPIIAVMGGSLDDVCGIATRNSFGDNVTQFDLELLDRFAREHNQKIAILQKSYRDAKTSMRFSRCINCFFIVLLVSVLLFDITHPTMGWVQYTVQAVTTAADTLKTMLTL